MTLRACNKIWKKQGKRVIGAAPTGKAAIELEEATGIPTDTIHWRLADFDRRFGFNCWHHLKQLARGLRGKRTYRLPEPISSSISTYQATSSYQDSQIISMEMAAYQFAGAAQTAATQAAYQPTTTYVTQTTTQTSGWGG